MSLSDGLNDPVEVARACFEFVRDQIKHSWDFQLNPVTCRASDVLKHGTGYCYAKSHLLAALLRANRIPAGLCYQRLTVANDVPPFCPPLEKLAFPIVSEGEADLLEVCAEPLPVVVRVFEKFDDYLQVSKNLPDIPIVRAYK